MPFTEAEYDRGDYLRDQQKDADLPHERARRDARDAYYDAQEAAACVVTADTVTEQQIKQLRIGAESRDDFELHKLCTQALGLTYIPGATRKATPEEQHSAREKCAALITKSRQECI